MRRILLVLLAVALLSGVMGAQAFAERSGGTLNFMAPYGGDVFGLDPHNSTRVQDFLISMNIHRCLYMWDPYQNKCVLDLADKVDISDDGLVYKYHIRENVKFHNGRQMTADDIIWSYNRIASMQPASPSALYIRKIKGAKDVEEGKADSIAGLKKIDDFNLEMTLEDPVAIEYALRQPGYRYFTQRRSGKTRRCVLDQSSRMRAFQVRQMDQGKRNRSRKIP